MREITLNAPTYDELQAIYMARRLYLPKNLPEFTHKEENGIYQRFFSGYNAYKDRKQLKNLLLNITEYRKELKTLNIRDRQVRTLNLTWVGMIYNILMSLVRMSFSLIFSVPGMAMLIPIGLIVSFVAEKERRQSLATSVIKVKGTDVMASVKVRASLVLYPVYCLVSTLMFFIYC